MKCTLKVRNWMVRIQDENGKSKLTVFEIVAGHARSFPSLFNMVTLICFDK